MEYFSEERNEEQIGENKKKINKKTTTNALRASRFVSFYLLFSAFIRTHWKIPSMLIRVILGSFFDIGNINKRRKKKTNHRIVAAVQTCYDQICNTISAVFIFDSYFPFKKLIYIIEF